jgi:predicted nucleic acid-binding protein
MKTDHFTKPLRGDYTNEALIPYEFWIKAADLVREIAMNDIAFVTLAEFLGIKLWTGDKELMRGWARKGYTNFITTDELYKLRTLLDG